LRVRITPCCFLIASLLTASRLSAADHYVATNGNDGAAGTIEAPFATIQHGVDQLAAGDSLYIRVGRYHEAVSINGLSGSHAAPITIQSYPGETVTLDGSEAITNSWSLYTGNIYTTTLTNDIWQLFVDDEMMTSARWPNADAWSSAMWDKENTWGHQHTNSSDGTFIDDGDRDLAGTGIDFTGAMAILNVGSWLSFARTVNSHGAGSDTFTYDPIGSKYHHKIENGSYFFEAAMACLDTSKEWYYNATSNALFLITDDGLSPAGRDVRGKTITYAFDISNSQALTVRGIDFFACTFKVWNSDHVTVEDCDALFPSYSKRMLGDLAKAEPTTMDGDSNALVNCTFRYADGSGLVCTGSDGVVENCLFQNIDYSCVGNLNDGIANIRNTVNMTFRHNTLDTGGNSVGVRGCPAFQAAYNRVTNHGHLQHDGSAIQTGSVYANGTVMHHNWIHDSLKSGLRFDSPWTNPEIYGTNGTMKYNVVWNARPIVPKGDYHTVCGNTGFNNGDFDISIFSDVSHGGVNSNTVTRNNAVHAISGENASGISPYSGITSHNWVGIEFDPDRVIQEQLVDPDAWDFRPAAGSELVDAGTNVAGVVTNFVGAAPDIGAYEYGDTHYWIPGYQPPEASIPIPGNGSTNQPEGRELIFLPGYKADSTRIYYGTNASSLVLLANVAAANNVIDPRDHGVTPVGNTTYFWRIDSVQRDGTTVTGTDWNYTTGDYAATVPTNLFEDNFEAYTVGTNPPSEDWNTQIKLGEGTIQVFDTGNNNATRLLNTTTDDRTVFGAYNAFAECVLITVSFDSYHDSTTPIVGLIPLSAGNANVASGSNQARRVGIASHVLLDTWCHFDWIVNQSGTPVFYTVDEQSYTVSAGTADLWRDGTRVLTGGTDKPSNALTDTTPMDSFGWTINKAHAADWLIDNVAVRNYAYVYVPADGGTLFKFR
jgi:hypothetical protein